jgi:hypothetical protein
VPPPCRTPRLRALASQLVDDETQAELLGVTYRDLDQTVVDTFDNFVRMQYCARGGVKGSNAQNLTGLNCRRDEVRPPPMAKVVMG